MFGKFKTFFIAAAMFVCVGAFASRADAATQARQFQLNGGFGLFVATDGLGPSFDFSLEPEFFFTEHATLSFRFDLTVGDVDSAHLGGRFRWYFDIPGHDKVNLYVGAGIGGVINFNGSNFGDAQLPVFGWQYDLTPHFKLGSEISFDILFNGNFVGFGTRLMPVVLKYAF